MKNRLFCAVFMLFLGAAIQAQDEQTEKSDFSFFSVWEIFKTASGGKLPWQPDWPVAIPSDAFSLDAERISVSITVEYDGGTLSLSRNKTGALSEFPVLRDGGFLQITTSFHASDGAIQGFRVNGENPTVVEFLEFDESGAPVIARINSAESWYFASFRALNDEVLETWFDEEGTFLCVFKRGEDGTAANRYYDAFGNITKIESEAGAFLATYNADGLRYWKRLTENYSFEHDERSRIVRMSGVDGTGAVDWRYEYVFDKNGNWVERRGIKMVEQDGVLVPAAEAVVTRTIEYQ